MTVFNFPDTAGQPTDGTFQWTSPTGRVYIWDGNSWTSRGDGSGGGGDANITVTDNLGSIEQPGQGDLAYHTVEARMYIYYEDDDSKQWVDASPGGDSIDNTPDAYVFMPTGGGDPKERVFYENEQVIDENYDITTGRNAMSAGPVTIADGVSIGVGSGQTWTVVGGADNSGGDGDSGLWTRSGTTVRPANAGDDVNVTNSVYAGTFQANGGANTNGINFRGITGGTETFRVDTNGSITTSGDNRILINSEHAGNVLQVNANKNGYGAAVVVSQSQVGTEDSCALFTGLVGGSEKFKVNGRGNTYIEGGILAKGGCYAPAGIDQGPGVALNPAGLVQLRRDGGRNDVFVCYNGGNANGNRTIRLYNNGDADFSGSVNPNVVITRSVIIDLEPDDPANYTSATNAEGETESVYNGPTLDVKDSLQKILAALVAIKAASQVAGTLDDLKSAIATATADITDGGNN